MKSVIEYNDSENIESKDFRIPSTRLVVVNDIVTNRMFNSKSPIIRQKISDQSNNNS